jgi:hypothetical protein
MLHKAAMSADWRRVAFPRQYTVDVFDSTTDETLLQLQVATTSVALDNSGSRIVNCFDGADEPAGRDGYPKKSKKCKIRKRKNFFFSENIQYCTNVML